MSDYVRVTEFLYPFSGLNKVDEIILENAAKRGTRVHSICEAIAQGLGEWDVEPAYEGYVQSFKHWWGEGSEIEVMEKRFYCDELMVTGQIDMILRRDDKLILTDLKTSANESKTWSVQGSAYIYLARKAGYDINHMEFIKLNKNGKPPRVFSYEPDIPFFKKSLEVYKYFFKRTQVTKNEYNKTFAPKEEAPSPSNGMG